MSEKCLGLLEMGEGALLEFSHFVQPAHFKKTVAHVLLTGIIMANVPHLHRGPQGFPHGHRFQRNGVLVEEYRYDSGGHRNYELNDGRLIEFVVCPRPSWKKDRQEDQKINGAIVEKYPGRIASSCLRYMTAIITCSCASTMAIAWCLRGVDH